MSFFFFCEDTQIAIYMKVARKFADIVNNCETFCYLYLITLGQYNISNKYRKNQVGLIKITNISVINASN